jgi:hypothetical protein
MITDAATTAGSGLKAPGLPQHGPLPAFEVRLRPGSSWLHPAQHRMQEPQEGPKPIEPGSLGGIPGTEMFQSQYRSGSSPRSKWRPWIRAGVIST